MKIILKTCMMQALFVSFFLISVNVHAETQEPAKQFEGFNLQGYKDDGQKAWDVKGDTADIDGSQITVSNVNANTYGEQKVNVIAETGKIDQVSGNMHLEKDVVVTSAEGAQLMTDTLDWSRDDDLVSTPDDVLITDERMTVSGTGMEAKPGLKSAQIHKDVIVTVDTQPEEEKKNDKLTITSDGPMELDQSTGIATFEDNVVAVQEGGRTLKADRMEIYFDQEMNQIKEMICTGNVEIIQGENQTFAEKAIYNAIDEKLRLVGRPKLILITEGDGAITSFGD